MTFRLFLVALLLSTASLMFVLFFPQPFERPITVDIPPNQYFSKVVKELKAKKLIRSATITKIIGKVFGYDRKVKTGEYLIDEPINLFSLLNLLSSGESIIYSVTFPEGSNIYEMAEQLDKKGLIDQESFLKWAKDQDFSKKLLGKKLYTLEGYLFPETYKITKYTGAKKLITVMVNRFLEVFETVRSLETDLARKFKNGQSMTREEVVILASIIEKETGAEHERTLISSVFHNRLVKNMRLETDPTILYGILDETQKASKNIRKKDIRRKNDYNTYTFRGLPKGPIANPGKEALIAALRPESSDFFFFVSRNDGTHFFSKTYAEHVKAVRRYQLSRRARQGKSWRNLNKRPLNKKN